MNTLIQFAIAEPLHLLAVGLIEQGLLIFFGNELDGTCAIFAYMLDESEYIASGDLKLFSPLIEHGLIVW